VRVVIDDAVRARQATPMKLSLMTASVAAALLVGGCNPPEADHASRAVEVAPAPVAPPGSRSYDVEAYDLRGHFDWTHQRLHARERITLRLLDAAQPIVELDAAVQIARVHAGGRDLPFWADAATSTLRVDLGALSPRHHAVSFEVEYEAAPSTSLIATRGRDGDPVTARVVFTDSEPDRGVYWLVANHHPADRARWSVELTVDDDEDVIANGHRVRDERCQGRRTVRYEIDEPLPTYLMAFAAGQLEHRDRRHGRVPLSVWYRRGLAIDADANLDVIADAMGTFEKLLGPYPWERYSVVLLPDNFTGGMENATITFNFEQSGQGSVNFTLDAHELSHHWFGDWVTMHDFDDVWVKEGMATLLEVEADRARRDSADTGRLFGIDFVFDPSNAVVDPTLHGVDKYTNGPYERAAWMITQIRATVGEARFWSSLRRILGDHALDSISGPEFVRSFGLDEAMAQKIVATLTLKPPPAIAIATQPGPEGTTLTLTLSDPSAAVVAPPTLTVVDAAGKAAPPVTLAVDAPTTLLVPYGGYLASDEKDVHPDWKDSFTIDGNAFWSQLAPLYLPWSPAALATLTSRSAAQQERALSDVWLSVPPSAFADFYAALDSTNARFDAATAACRVLHNEAVGGQQPNPWPEVLAPVLEHPAMDRFATIYSYCGSELATQALLPELLQLVPGLDAEHTSRAEYLMSFDYGAATSFDLLSRVGATGPSLQLRELATRRLAQQAAKRFAYSPVDAAALPAWKAFFRDRLTEATTVVHFNISWFGVTSLGDEGALPIAATKLHTVELLPARQRQVVCDAYRLAGARAGAWAEFQQAAQPWSELSPAAQAVLIAPAGCAQPAMQALVVGAAPTVRAIAARPDAHVGEPRHGSPIVRDSLRP
jgi:hypothetical protein